MGEVDLASMFGLNEFMSRNSKIEPDKIVDENVYRSNIYNYGSGINALKNQQSSFQANVTQQLKREAPGHSELSPAKVAKIASLSVKQKADKLKTQALTRLKSTPTSVKCSPDSSDPDLLIQYSFLCPYCSFISAHKSSVHRHVGTTHASLQNADPKTIGEKMLFLCRFCSFNSNHKTSAKRHIKTIHKDRESLENSPSNERCSQEVALRTKLVPSSVVLPNSIPYPLPKPVPVRVSQFPPSLSRYDQPIIKEEPDQFSSFVIQR